MKYKSNLKIFKNDLNKFVKLIKINEIPERDKIVNLLQIYLKDIFKRSIDDTKIILKNVCINKR